MKTTSANPEKATAYGYLITNLLVLPGIGTLMAGKKTEGLLQMAVSLVGVSITLWGIFKLLMTLLKSFSNIFTILGTPPFWLTVGGILIFIVAWIWSAASVYPLIQKARENE